MFFRLLVLFIVVPVFELMMLIEVGKVIGFWPTVGLIIFTGILGSSLTKQQGMSVWNQFNGRLQKGELPGTELVDGLIILIAGVLLITPGILTDVVGLLGLLPPSRSLIRKFVQKRIKLGQANGTINFSTNMFDSQGPAQNATPDTNPEWQGVAREKPTDQ